MAVFIEANYSKKIGLPAYSSHSFSVTLRSEVSELKDVDREASKLYAILQGAVDAQIVETGYTPVPLSSGSESNRPSGRTNGHTHQSDGESWNCSDKQRDLVLKIRDEHKLGMDQIEEISKQLFQRPAKTLNKLEMSVLIKELLEEFGPKGATGNGNGRRPYQPASRR